MVIGIPVNKVETAGIKLPGTSYLQMTWNLHNAYRTFACAVKLWPFLWHCARCALVSRSDSKLAKLDLMIMISWKKSTNSFWMTEWGDIHIVLKTDTSAEWSCSHGLPRAPVFGSEKYLRTRSSCLNCALRDDEAVYWVQYEAVSVGNWWYWVSRGHSCLYILYKVEIWTGVTDAWLTDWQLWKIELLSSL